MLQGIGASQGFGIGKAVIIEDMKLDYSAVKYIMLRQKRPRRHSFPIYSPKKWISSPSVPMI